VFSTDVDLGRVDLKTGYWPAYDLSRRAIVLQVLSLTLIH
jgi:hypothetical protein